MRIVTITNPTPLESPFTMVSQDYTSGIVLQVEDSSAFKDNDLVLIGGVGNEKAETTDITSTPPAVDQLPISALDHEHSTDEAIQAILWDKFDVDYKVDSTSSWINLVAGQNFDWSAVKTSYVHSDGLSNYYYRVRYYNSAKANYSDYSNQISGIGSTRNSVGSMIEQVRENAKDKTNQKVSDDLIISYFNYAQDIIKSMNKKWPWLQGEATIDPVTLALPDNFKRAYRLKYTFVSATENKTYYLTYMPLPDFEDKYGDANASTSDILLHYSIDTINGIVKIGPTPTTASAILVLVYEKDIVDLSEFDDETIIPLPELLIAYATAKVFKLKSNPDEYTSWMNDFSDLLQVLDQSRPISYHPKTIKRFIGRGVYTRYETALGTNNNGFNEDDI